MANAAADGDRIIITLQDLQSAQTTPLSDLSNDKVLAALEALIRQRKADMPPNSYTTHLFEKGEEKILKKMGEECIEVILAKDNNKDIIYESADLIYHLMVYLVYKNIPFNDILEELKSR
ncbi:MAG: phosphoribosyl-ATP diphosphatase [Spirochaetales bacterium]|nr:phosphoribosyl-ATP diphosphatase [Spirochaetales bacterium]